MNALFFLIITGWKNRVLRRIRRLRNPKYLVSAVVGAAYLYFSFLRQPFMHGFRSSANGPILDPGMLIVVETGFACMALVYVLIQFFLANTRTAVFNETEVQVLFPSPVSHAALVNYRIAKPQIGILFGALISLVLFRRSGLFPRTLFLLITIWAVYSLLNLYRIGLLMASQSLQRQGAQEWRRKARVAGIIILIALAVAVSAQWFYPAPPKGAAFTMASVLEWLIKICGSGPVFYLLFPFRLLVHPAFAVRFPQFLLRLLPMLAAMAALYGWIRLSAKDLEESVAGQARRTEWPGMARGRGSFGSGRPAFALAPEGSAPIAILWKNLYFAGGFSVGQALGVAAFIIVAVLLISASGESAPTMIGSASASLAVFLALMGPVIFRNDLRNDLGNIDILKAYPIPGWKIVLGEALGPAISIGLMQWGLILLSAAVIPNLGEHPWKLSARVSVGLGAALLLPCFSLIGVLVQNAAVLLLPGWLHSGKERQRGVEAMGQRLLSGIATLISFLIAAIPAAFLFLIAWISGYWLIGLAVVPVASLVAALGLIAEAAVSIFWIGRLFDRFDASGELSY
jgi:ABC-2 type transport system permease protein